MFKPLTQNEVNDIMARARVERASFLKRSVSNLFHRPAKVTLAKA